MRLEESKWVAHGRTLMRVASAPAWSGRMMSHSGLGLGGADILRMGGLEVRVVMGVEEEGRRRMEVERGRREGSIEGEGGEGGVGFGKVGRGEMVGGF